MFCIPESLVVGVFCIVIRAAKMSLTHDPPFISSERSLLNHCRRLRMTIDGPPVARVPRVGMTLDFVCIYRHVALKAFLLMSGPSALDANNDPYAGSKLFA